MVSLSESEVEALAVIRSTPNGIVDAEDLSLRSRGKISADIAQTFLNKFENGGFINKKPHVVMTNGKTRRIYHHEFALLAYRDSHLNALIDQLNLPISSITDADPNDRIPERFYHFFWNTDPRNLDIEYDGTYIALQLLEAVDYEATDWVFANISPENIRRILDIRDVDPQIRRLIEVYSP
ncbi:MAG: hypothetical protein FWG25_06175 [Promicromonosporaceae bacterium]|nr:hypothetical protein [Promicromonosporaceae bacterium]